MSEPSKAKHKPSLIGSIRASKPKKGEIALFGRKQLFDLRPTDIARIHAGLEMEGKNPAETGQLGFSSRCLVQANIPHSNPGKDASFWVRRNGDFSISIQSDVVVNSQTGKEELVGIPFGNIPRLVLIYICSEAKRTKSREISLGDNLSAFLRALGMEPRGGKRGDITRFKDQMNRLVTSRIKFEHNDNRGKTGFNASIAKQYFFFWDSKDPDQPSLWENKIILDADFYDEIVSSSVPIHLGAVAMLKSSSFDLDLYTWLTFRVSYLSKPAMIKWTDLQEQVGANYASTKDFGKRARKVLLNVKTLWPGLDYKTVRGGFVLNPCEPSVPRLKEANTPQKLR